MQTRQLRVLAFVALVLWLAVEWWGARAPHIGVHWRQAETQSIALNFMDEFRPFFPRINWGGDGPGYVDAEFQLYPLLVASISLLFGPHEMIGQLLSLVFLSISLVVLYTYLERRFGVFAAMASVAWFMAGPVPVELSVAVMPDALAALAFVVAWERFDAFERSGRSGSLTASTLGLTLAGLIKPTALCIGIAQASRQLLPLGKRWRDLRVWFSWIFALACVAAFLAHGVAIHEKYGNTFGIISGGDSKFPRLADLTSAHILKQTLRATLGFGPGHLGALAVVTLMARRKMSYEAWGLLLAAAASILVPLRYASQPWLGCHYHLYAGLIGTWFVAAAIVELQSWLPRIGKLPMASLLLGVLVPVTSVRYVHSLAVLHETLRSADRDSVLAVGTLLKSLRAPGDLLMAQSGEESYDHVWKRADNFQDPRLFYVAQMRGWSIEAGLEDDRSLNDYAKRGAAYYASATTVPPVVQTWLNRHAHLVGSVSGGVVYQINR